MARASGAAGTPSTLGKVLKDLRSQAGLSIQALARRAKVAPILISRVESGVRATLEAETLAKIAAALDVDVVPLLVAAGVIPPTRARRRQLPVDDRHALAERLAKIERRLERDRRELADIREALLRRHRD
jgi:transcriptional regulator with XRE-family HTH domain